MYRLLIQILIPLWFSAQLGFATDYYIDATSGSDDNPGDSPDQPWNTLSKASSAAYQAGDRILLKSGETFPGKLSLFNAIGTESDPIKVASYGDGDKPIINAAGHLAGIHVRDSSYIEISDLEITADGGATLDGSDSQLRYGIFVNATTNGSFDHITIRDLYIHDIYPEEATEHEGKNPTTYLGTAISLRGSNTPSSYVFIKDCRIERPGYKAIELLKLTNADVLDNYMKDIGGPAIQPSRVDDLLVRGNTVDGSGAYTDPRMHGRGSGIWPWTSNRVLIEKNRFMHARGRADTCGVHIDWNCTDVVVQHNLSLDNEGGFLEILGNNYNCAYRYNISINDGARVSGENGANQWGHTLWLSSYSGRNNPRNGPFNSYIYNNTIYTKVDIVSKYAFARTTEGALIANNIFYVEGESANVYTNWENSQEPADATHQHIVWKNNLYLKADTLPADLPITDAEPLVGDPLFLNTGGFEPEDYIPTANVIVEDRGIAIEKLPGDEIGLRIGLEVMEDFFGNPIIGAPDLGAIELANILIDSDNDDIPDQVEIDYGLDPNDPSDGLLDLDGDGLTNQVEYRVGTRLDDPFDQIRASVVLDRNTASLKLASNRLQNGRIYILEHSSDFSAADPWTSIQSTTITPEDLESELSFEIAPSGEQTGFYRIRIEWPD